MNAKELIELLSSVPGDTKIILQKDAEGEGYSPLRGVDCDNVYVPDSTWSGNAYSTTWSAGDACMNESEWIAIKSQPHCVVLFPVN